jgi:phasin family protein
MLDASARAGRGALPRFGRHRWEAFMAELHSNGDLFPDLSRMMGDWRLPGFDLQAMAQYQRRNIEAFTQANQMALEGTQEWMRRNLDLARETMADVSAMLGELTKPTVSMEDRLAQHANYSKKAIEKGLANFRDLAELVTKANTEAFGVLTKRMTEGLEEVREIAQPKAG